MVPRLGINIDHVATLRQAREESYPSVVEAANICLAKGADQITIHLREDRRHIQDTDVGSVQMVTKKYGKPLNLEMGCDPEIVEIGLETAPEWVCLVPEKREERTTEGGLDLLDAANYSRVSRVIEQFRSQCPQTKISLFLEGEQKTLEVAAQLKVDAVEVHTGDYARAFEAQGSLQEHFEQFSKARDFLLENNIGHHAGHGLTYESVKPLVERQLFIEYNIGHWVICQAVFDGLGSVVERMKALFDSAK